MNDRCHNPKNTSYRNYGGRGIYVCEQWRSDFLQFVRDIGARPSEQHSIDRIDNDGPYTPEKFRWTTFNQQFQNRRCSFYVKGHYLADLAKQVGIKRQTLRNRIERGWTFEEAISVPVHTYQRKSNV